MISAEPAQFEAQLDLIERHMDVISMTDLLDLESGRLRIRSHAAAITFDDAYRDVAEHAWPVLRSRKLPATLFVPTGYPDQPHRSFWWDRLHHALATTRQPALAVDGGSVPLRSRAERRAGMARLRTLVKSRPHASAMALVDRWCRELETSPPLGAVLGWEELRHLKAEGMILASHTVDHPLLTAVTPDEARAEIAGGMRDLQQHLGVDTPVFAYPSGAHDLTVRAIVRDSGIRLAFTTRRGSIRPGRSDWLRLPRVNIGPGTTTPILDAELAVLPRIAPCARR